MMVLCYECWCHILEFYNFQQNVKLAQLKYDKARRQRKVIRPTEPNISMSYEQPEYEEVTIKQEPLGELIMPPELGSLSVENSLENSRITSTENLKSSVKSEPTGNSPDKPSTRKTKNLATQRSKTLYKKTYDNCIAKIKPRLECEICSKSFATFSILQCHFRSAHPNDEFHIMCCNHKFTARARLEDHLRLHSNDPYKCEGCRRIFKSKYTLIRHKQICIKYRNINSSVEDALPSKRSQGKKTQCKKMYDERIAKMRPTLKCEICSESFPTFSMLQRHCRNAHPNEDFYVKCCDRKFKGRSQLDEHLRSHCNDPFVCKRCGRCFKWRSNLRVHKCKTASTITKPPKQGKYKCTLCDKRYTTNASLSDHMTKHSGIKKYTCTHCPKEFAYGTGLRRHLARYHSYLGSGDEQ